jgi:hypothetical protein
MTRKPLWVRLKNRIAPYLEGQVIWSSWHLDYETDDDIEEHLWAIRWHYLFIGPLQFCWPTVIKEYPPWTKHQVTSK